MDDFEKRARDSAEFILDEHGEILDTITAHEETFVLGVKWAQTEMQAKAYEQANIIQSMYEEIERLKRDNDLLYRAKELYGPAGFRHVGSIMNERDRLKAELAATKRDNATLNLANHLPPRPRCPDCGIESLYGSVHTDECIKTSDLHEELERAKCENDKLHAILSELIEMYDTGFPMGDSKVYFNKARAALDEVSK